MKELSTHIKLFVDWLESRSIGYAIVGGIAVSFRAIERTTKDVDIAISVKDDKEAENIILSLTSLGYRVDTLLEQKISNRLATVRLLNGFEDSIYIDLLFASSGIENEIIQDADVIEILPNVKAKVASLSSLIAMKVLSADSDDRLQDILDIKSLIKNASQIDLDSAKNLMKLITERNYNRNKDLIAEFDSYLNRFLPK
jgi:hypothetical protein